MKDASIEIIQSEEQKNKIKIMKKKPQRLGTTSTTLMYMQVESQRGEKKRKEKIFEEIVAENFPSLIKNMLKSSTNSKWEKYKEIQT